MKAARRINMGLACVQLQIQGIQPSFVGSSSFVGTARKNPTLALIFYVYNIINLIITKTSNNSNFTIINASFS
jgi:hypothetical protein